MLNRSQHLSLLQDLLRKIYLNRSLRTCLGFKGGTALLLFHQLDRFSTDLDFDLLDENFAAEEINLILRNYAGQIGTIKEKDSSNGPQSIRIIVSYKNDATKNIKLDVSKRRFSSSYEIKNYLGISIKVMVKEDIFAHKLVATTDRSNSTNRDLYDLYFMLDQKWNFNDEIIKERLGKSFQEYLPELIEHIKNRDRKHILNGIGEVLGSEKKIWVKDNLLDELVFKLECLSAS